MSIDKSALSNIISVYLIYTGAKEMKICIYGASGDNISKEYFEAAEQMGRLIAAGGHSLVFGGGASGLMGACARGVSAGEGEIIGVAPRFFDVDDILYKGCTRFIYTDTMRQRKQIMEDESDAFIVLPGGIGTFEEFFEMLTLKQLGRHAKPMAVLNTLGYYDAMYTMLKNAADGGFMSKNCLKLFGFVDTPEMALEHIMTAEVITGSIKRLSDYNK